MSQLLINKAAVKKFTLESAKCRAHKFTRVSKSFYENMDAILRSTIRQRLDYMPSKGVTIK